MRDRGAIHSLFDVEDETVMPHVRDMTVGRVSMSDVREFAKRYHYTGSGSWGHLRLGLWHNAVLHGVVTYNLPPRGAGRSVFDNGIDVESSRGEGAVWHMSRLALSEDSPRNSESRLIGGSLRVIERDYPNVWGVLTFADSAVGHIGTIYQATNALYLGVSDGGSGFFLDAAGDRHSWLSGSKKRHDGRWAADVNGWTRHAGGVKHRYLYVLGSKTQRRQRRGMLKFPIFPYPKTVMNQSPGDSS